MKNLFGSSLLVVLSTFMSANAYSVDEGYRFKQGKCVNAEGKEGLNPRYIGECGDLKRVILGRFEFVGKSFKGARFDGADLRLSVFKDCDFDTANLTGANLSGIDVENSNFARTDLRNSNLTQAVFLDTSFKASNLENANLSDSDLNGITFRDAYLKGVNLQKAKVISVDFTDVNLSESNLEEIQAEEVLFDGVDFRNVKLSQGLLKGASAKRANFTGLDLKKFDFSGVNLENAVFKEAKLGRAIFEGSRLKGVDFTAADLRGTNLKGIELAEIKMDGAKFSRKTLFSYSIEEAQEAGLVFVALLEFEGVMQNLNPDDLEGWKMCNKSTYAQSVSINKIKEDCAGEQLMMACRKIGETDYHIAAQGSYKTIFTQSNNDRTSGIVENGVKFYYHNSQSIGFAPADVALNKNSCDFPLDSEKGELRMCSHTGGGSITSGWRCGKNIGNNSVNGSNSEWERFFFVAE